MDKRYFGTFKDIKNKDIFVEITPSSGTYTEEVELKFPYETPVTIERDSDGIFTPIKDSAATITIFTDEIYWDIYDKSITGAYVKIYSVDDNGSEFVYFAGYLTPCIYTQDYAYKSEIELEAVDFLAVLDGYDYVVEGDRDIITIDGLLNKIFDRLPNIGTPKYINDVTSIDFTKYHVQEANFFDNDDEPMTCKDILEELLSYLGITATMYNGVIHFIDYFDGTNRVDDLLSVSKYGEGTPTIELDEVYNKIYIGNDLYEIDKVVDDVIDDENKTITNELKIASNGVNLKCDYGFSWREWNSHTKPENDYVMMLKPYTFIDDTIDQKNAKISRWSTFPRGIYNQTPTRDGITDRAANDCGRFKDINGNALFVPYYSGAYPIREYCYSKNEDIKSVAKINWNDYILLPHWGAGNEETGNMTPVYPCMAFSNNNKLAYSLSSGTGYIVINAGLYLQSQIGIAGGPDEDLIYMWAYLNGVQTKICNPVCLDNCDIKVTEGHEYAATRKSGDDNYNKGWNLITAKLQIGNKYWNGSTWTTTDTTFSIPFHDANVATEKETLSYYKWLEVARNTNVIQASVGKEGYAIPITPTDLINGKLIFTLYTPSIYQAVGDARPIPNYFMRDLTVEYAYTGMANYLDDEVADEDIVYENEWEENDLTVQDMEEKDLKINSYNPKYTKPISKSYLLDFRKLPVEQYLNRISADTFSTKQEENLIYRYYSHYHTPKKILNLNYKVTDIPPLLRYQHFQTNTKYYVDEYEMNLKTGETQLKLIEL